MKEWSMRSAGWVNEAINTHLEYVIFSALPREQSLCERALVLLYT
jgi:hypothetical protein